ncbi:hypothetical protein EXVG_00240 [Emiliania huxleyi virus 202]|nr:hypothetical protein EXVG_00240 [Emiliania huxleyi virus 202]AHA54142.1 putative membrane protein [Emiliania huxleyi virus 18]AHA55188.1 putative membrane protein [Emiliania huxleyi virus 156]
MFQTNKLILLTFMGVMSLSYATVDSPPMVPPSPPPSVSPSPPPSASPSPPIPSTPPPSLPPSSDDGIYYVYAIDVIVPIMFISCILAAAYFFICKKREQPNPGVQTAPPTLEIPTVYNTIPPLGTQPASTVTSVPPDNNGISQPITPRTPLTQSTTRVVNLADMQTIDTRTTDNPFMTVV